MLDLEENKRKLMEVQEQLKNLFVTLQISKLKEDFAELEKETLQPDFWEQAQQSSAVFSQMNVLQKKVRSYESLEKDLENLLELNDLLLLEKDDSLEKELVSNTQKLQQNLADLEVQTLLSGKYDKNNAILTIHPGARRNGVTRLG